MSRKACKNNKVIIICKLDDDTDIRHRKRVSSGDTAGESIVIFSKKQVDFLGRKTEYMYGHIHKETYERVSRIKRLPLSSYTYKPIMKAANDYMTSMDVHENTRFVGPAYLENVEDYRILDFQTVVSGSVEETERTDLFTAARREVVEEIGLPVKKIELIDTRIIRRRVVSTFVATI